MDNKCIFCDRRNFEERIIHENNNFFIIATLGQITDGGYLLLIPKDHLSCIGAANKTHLEKVDAMQKRIVELLMFEYHVPAVSIFEHGIAGQTIGHAHIHFIPTRCNIDRRIKKDFPSSDTSAFYSWTRLGTMYKTRKKPYLVYQNRFQEDLWKTAIWNPYSTPAQYLRTIFAEEFGRPERANWKHVDPESDRNLILETVDRMKKYFK